MHYQVQNTQKRIVKLGGEIYRREIELENEESNKDWRFT